MSKHPPKYNKYILLKTFSSFQFAGILLFESGLFFVLSNLNVKYFYRHIFYGDSFGNSNLTYRLHIRVCYRSISTVEYTERL